jgi:hypothetical protein
MNLVVVWPSRGAIISRRMLGWTDGSPWGERGYIWPDFNNKGRCGLVVEEYAGAGDVDPVLVSFEQVSLVTVDYEPEEGDDDMDVLPAEMDEVTGFDTPRLAEPMEEELLIRLIKASEYMATGDKVQALDSETMMNLKWIGYVDLLNFLHCAIAEAEDQEAASDPASWATAFREFVGEMLLIEAMSYGD